MKRLIFAGVLLIFMGCNNSENTEDNSKIEELNSEILKLERENDSLVNLIKTGTSQSVFTNSYFDTISNTESYLKEVLNTQPELIPKEAVLGGVMHFTVVKVISDDLILTEYEDGHVLGKAIFKVELKNENSLGFSLVTVLD